MTHIYLQKINVQVKFISFSLQLDIILTILKINDLKPDEGNLIPFFKINDIKQVQDLFILYSTKHYEV